MKTVIFDMDGTLVNVDHRRHFVERDVPDWASFNEAMSDDTPNQPIIELCRAMSVFANIVVLTARHEEHMHVTRSQLLHFNVPYNKLLMRDSGDFRKDTEVKFEMLEQLRATMSYNDILFAVDDRQSVVDMWRANGITCLQCAEGDF